MDDTLFQHIINNQSKWCKLYELQENEARKERRKINAEKQWYGKTKEYKKEWDLNNKRHKHLNDC